MLQVSNAKTELKSPKQPLEFQHVCANRVSGVLVRHRRTNESQI